MDLCGIIHESNISRSIHIGSRAGQQALTAGLHRWSSNTAELAHRANKFRSFQHTLSTTPDLQTKLASFYTKYRASEHILDTVLVPPTEESKESKSQLIFTSPHLQPLNYAPFLLTLLYIMKAFVTPVIALLLPVMVVILPYYLMKYSYGMPIDFNYYWNMMSSMVFKSASSTMEKVQRVGHLGWVAVSIGQSIIQPITTASHVRSLNAIYAGHHQTIIDLYASWQELIGEFNKKGWGFSDKAYAPWFQKFCGDARMFIVGLHNTTSLQCWIREIGDLETLYYFWGADASHVTIKNYGNSPYLSLTGAYDPQIPEASRKPINVNLKGHAILTGPNRGGKSTALRAILINVLLAQTYGITLAKKMIYSPVSWVHTCLRLEDIPGNQSLFEREVFMAARSLRRMHGGAGIILIDELFHSTNPSDSNRASKVYTKQLWNSGRVLSVISTHDFDLVESANDTVERWCCHADELEDGVINYSYTLGPGICQVSSVNEILVEKGVIPKHSAQK